MATRIFSSTAEARAICTASEPFAAFTTGAGATGAGAGVTGAGAGATGTGATAGAGLSFTGCWSVTFPGDFVTGTPFGPTTTWPVPAPTIFGPAHPASIPAATAAAIRT